MSFQMQGLDLLRMNDFTNNLACGYKTMIDNLLSDYGGNNSAFGNSALASKSTGSYNTAIGSGCLSSLTTGQYNTAVGAFSCLNDLTTADYNTAVGAGCLKANNGQSNTAIGYGALSSDTNCSFNVAIGVNANHGNTGDSNICIGKDSGPSTTTITKEISIFNGTIHVRQVGSEQTWTFPSDARDKTSIEDLTLGLDFISKLQPRKYQWNFRHTENSKGEVASGFIAQEVLAVVDEFDARYTGIVNMNNENQFTLGQTNLIPMLVNAVKDLSARLKTLEEKSI